MEHRLIDTYIGKVGNLFAFFLVPCSLLYLLAHERRALCEPGLLVLLCYFVVVPSTTLRFESRTSSHLARVSIAAIIITVPESDLVDVTGRVDEHESM